MIITPRKEGGGSNSSGQSQVEDARAYIAGQEDHHRKIPFQEEYRRLLQRYEVEFDERYVWD
jgi:putative transposase